MMMTMVGKSESACARSPLVQGLVWLVVVVGIRAAPDGAIG